MRYKKVIVFLMLLLTIALMVPISSSADVGYLNLNGRDEKTADFRSDRGERITNYQSDIIVNPDSTMLVKETISVTALGEQIKRGIYRDFPTTYYDSYKNKYTVNFDVMTVLKDGNKEPFGVEPISNGKRIYIGDPNVYLSPGQYNYTIIYYTNRQLGFFKDHDELYWNVTGNDWAFPIDNVSARVSLPTGVQRDSIKLEAYTGYKGLKGNNYSSRVDADNQAVFTATRPLDKGEGLTIVVSWPKGFVNEPTSSQKIQYFLTDNLMAILAIITILIILLYYFIMWNIFGRDPKKGVIIPLYEPPNGLSPASVRYISKMEFDNKTLTAAIINMAVKGYLRIEEHGKYSLVKSDNPNASVLSPEENVIAQVLFISNQELGLTDKVYQEILDAVRAGKQILKGEFEKTYFSTNSSYSHLGIGLSIICLILNIGVGTLLGAVPNPAGFAFSALWVAGWTAGVGAFIRVAIIGWKALLFQKSSKIPTAAIIFLSIFMLPFIGVDLWMIIRLATEGGFAITALLILLVAVNVIFYSLLKAYTVEGRKVLDSIEGFKLFLGVAEKDRLNYMFPMDKTPELFEKYLPYALAMDVEQEWAEQFAGVFASLANSQGGYTPSWYYSGSGDYMSITDFTSSFSNSFSNAVSSSSSPPGSSSGSGGGGSSGGGGGGGGGGGW